MENSKRPPSAAELLKKIQEMEQRQAYIKQEIYKLKLSAYLSKLGYQTTSSDHQLTVGRPCALMEPLAMKLTEIQYLNILHSIGQAVHVYDLKQRIIFWNRAAENLYGYTAAEAYGKTPSQLLVEPTYTSVGNYVEERTTHGDNWYGVFPLITKYRERFMAICAVTPYRDEYSRQLAAICISCDSRQYPQVSLTACAPTTISRARHERDSQQPQQTSTSSKISNFVSKVKMKLKRGDYYKDYDDSTFNQSGYNFSQAHEYGQQMRSRASSSKLISQLCHLEGHKREVLERYFSSMQVSSGHMSINSNSINEVDGETDELDLDYDSL